MSNICLSIPIRLMLLFEECMLTFFPSFLFQILVVNQMACRLLGFSPDELCGLTLVQLLNRQHAHTPNALSEEHLDTTHGTTLGVSGKVVS